MTEEIKTPIETESNIDSIGDLSRGVDYILDYKLKNMKDTNAGEPIDNVEQIQFIAESKESFKKLTTLLQMVEGEPNQFSKESDSEFKDYSEYGENIKRSSLVSFNEAYGLQVTVFEASEEKKQALERAKTLVDESFAADNIRAGNAYLAGIEARNRHLSDAEAWELKESRMKSAIDSLNKDFVYRIQISLMLPDQDGLYKRNVGISYAQGVTGKETLVLFDKNGDFLTPQPIEDIGIDIKDLCGRFFDKVKKIEPKSKKSQ